METQHTCRAPVIQAVRHRPTVGHPRLDLVRAARRIGLNRTAVQHYARVRVGGPIAPPLIRASATAFEPWVAANGHAVAGTALRVPDVAAQPSAWPQQAEPVGFQATSTAIVLHNTPPTQKASAEATHVQPAKPLGSGDAGKSLKRPPNAYALFVKDQYSAVLRRLPECSHDMASVSRALAAAWRRLPVDERTVYRERAEELLRLFYERRHEVFVTAPAAAAAPVATEPALRRLSADLSLAEETLGEVQEQMMALLANYHCLGSDVEFLEAQLWNQAGVLRSAVRDEVGYRIQQLAADNAKLWLFAVTQHQNAIASAQALQVAQLQLEVRSLRAAVTAAEAAKPRTAVRVLLTSVTTAAAAVLAGVLVMAVLPGASGAWRAGVAAGSQMQLQQPYTAPATLIVGVIIAAAAAAQLFASAFATKADMY